MFSPVKFLKEMAFGLLLKTIATFGMNWQSGKVYPDWQNDVDYYPGGFVYYNQQIYCTLNASGPNITTVGKIPGAIGSEDYWLTLQELLPITMPIPLSTRWSFVGDIQEFHRPVELLPFGWFALTGDGYLKDSPQGKKLLEIKSQEWWQVPQQSIPIIEDADLIYLPKWAIEDGRMPITRPIDGINRLVGALQQDAIREITANSGNDQYQTGFSSRPIANSGAFKFRPAVGKLRVSNLDYPNYMFLEFAASESVPTAPENIMLNRGTTIAMFLNVAK